MKKKAEPLFEIGNVVRVVMPIQVLNLKETEEMKLDVDEVLLIGDEGLIVSEVEYLERQKEYLYKVLTGIENALDAKIFAVSEEQITLY
jgi:hypothetical protein